MGKNIILIGEMGSGKDCLASYMPGYIRVAFGDKIRDIAMLARTHPAAEVFFHLSRIFNYEPPTGLMKKIKSWKNYSKTNTKDRELLQDIGTYCRKHEDDLWVRQVLSHIKPCNNYVITDCRRYSELEACKEWLPVYIDSTLEERKERIINRDGEWKEEWTHHEAEKEILLLRDYCNVIVLNHGEKEELKDKADQIIRLPRIFNNQIII